MTDTTRQPRGGGGEGLDANVGLAVLGVVIAAMTPLWLATNLTGVSRPGP